MHVCYYWLHESHVTFMVSDLKKRDDLTRVGGWKDVKERTILSRSSLFRAPTPPRLLSYAYILRTLVHTHAPTYAVRSTGVKDYSCSVPKPLFRAPFSVNAPSRNTQTYPIFPTSQSNACLTTLTSPFGVKKFSV